MLLDRMSLSAKNGWRDDTGRVYIYYTVKEVCEKIGCGRNKAMRLLAELDTNKGIGLIERVKQGQGKPDKIFVKQITVQEDTEEPTTTDPNLTTPISEVEFSDIQRSENPTSRSRENRPLEVSKPDPNKTKKIRLSLLKSIYPSFRTAYLDAASRTAPLTVLSEQVCHLLNTNDHLLGGRAPPKTPEPP